MMDPSDDALDKGVLASSGGEEADLESQLVAKQEPSKPKNDEDIKLATSPKKGTSQTSLGDAPSVGATGMDEPAASRDDNSAAQARATTSPESGGSDPDVDVNTGQNNASIRRPGAYSVQTPLNPPAQSPIANNNTAADNNPGGAAELADLLGIPLVEAEAVDNPDELVAVTEYSSHHQPMTPSSNIEEGGGGEENTDENKDVIHATSVPTITICGKSFHRSTVGFVGVLLAMAALMVGVAVPLAIKSKESENDPQGIQEEDPMEILKREARAERRKVLLDILMDVSGRNGTTPFTGHRAEALEWLVDDFPANITSATEMLDYYPEWKMKQRYIIALLYFSTNGPEWYAQLNFLSNMSECYWKGTIPRLQGDKMVVYDMNGEVFDETSSPSISNRGGIICTDDGRVDSISLGVNNLVGTIPEEIAGLRESLTKFGLMRNTISSTIPSSLLELENLQTLNLKENCLTGEIPEGLSSLSLKEAKFVGNNDLKGNLNGFCNGTEYREHSFKKGMEISADCGDCPGSTALIECTCCHCCDFNTMSCCEKDGEVKEGKFYAFETFTRGECSLNDVQEAWQEENCPCFRENPDWGKGKNDRFICSTDCPE